MGKLLILLVIAVVAGGWLWAQASAGRRAEPPETRVDRPAAQSDEKQRVRQSPLPGSTCPADLAGCRAVRGQVLYVEAVDPDGDGDLHVVLSGGGITAPGVTSVDVAPGLRPRRTPRIGDLASAAGQVQRGSFRQSQIHAVEFHVRRR